jgi:hypothetical protein
LEKEKLFTFYGTQGVLLNKPYLAEKAIDMALTVFPYLCDESHDQCHIVVLDPVKVKNGFKTIEDAIMMECGINHPPKKYFDIARSKATVCAKNGCCSHFVQQFEPYMLEKNDTKYQGGVCYQNWIVAVSGFRAEKDELLAWYIIHTLIALSEIEMKTIMDNKEKSYL